MTRVICILAVLLMLCSLCLLVGCNEPKILHCDHCGVEVDVGSSSNMEEDWLIYCETCNEELFADNPVFDFDDNPLA